MRRVLGKLYPVEVLEDTIGSVIGACLGTWT